MKCPECGFDVSDGQEECSECGEYLKSDIVLSFWQIPVEKKLLLIAVLVFIVVGLVGLLVCAIGLRRMSV